MVPAQSRALMKNRTPSVVERRLLRFDSAKTLRQALDFSYRRLRESARQSWERHFSGDPSDSCVTVRCSGFLPTSKAPKILPKARFGQ
jgi:hypothetical protein